MSDRSKFGRLDTPPVHPFHKTRPCLGQEMHIFEQPVKKGRSKPKAHVAATSCKGQLKTYIPYPSASYM